MIDSKTISAVLDGNPQAFEKVYLQTHDKAYSIAYRLLKDEYEAEDIVQDAYLTMIEKLCDLKDAERLEGWFYRIVQNGAKDNLRKRHAEVFSSFDNDEEDFQFSDTIVSDYTPFDPEATADYEELKRIMDGFVMGLPEMQRKCILLRFREDKKISEIAKMLGIPEATVKSNLNYGKRKIEGEVRALEKQGVKLYSLTPLTVIAFLRWMWGNTSSAKAAAIYTAGTAAAASGSVAAGATVSGATVSGAAVSGAAAKIGIALTAKQIAAGIIAAVAITGGAAAIAKPELFTSLFTPTASEVLLEEPTEESFEETQEPAPSTETETTVHKHIEERKLVVAASCVVEGLETVICSECGEQLDSITIPALGHDYQLTDYRVNYLSAANQFPTNLFAVNLSNTYAEIVPAPEEANEAGNDGVSDDEPADSPDSSNTPPEEAPIEAAPEPPMETSTESTAEPPTEAVTEPPTEPTPEPPTEAATEPPTEPTAEPTTEAATEPPTEPTAEPTTEAATEPLTEPTAEPTTEAAAKPVTEPPTEPAENNEAMGWYEYTCTRCGSVYRTYIT